MTAPQTSAVRRFAGDVDQLLRGGFTRSEDLRIGRISVPVRRLVYTSLFFGAVYGIAMGLYSLTMKGAAGGPQMIASAIKVPLLFLLTLLVTFPSLYVFSALSRSRLFLGNSLRLLLAAVAVNLALLASFGTVTAFFTLCTDSYPFMVVLNVLFFGVAGFIGLGFLRQALSDVFAGGEAPTPDAVERDVKTRDPWEIAPDSPRKKPRETSLRVFKVWLVIYGVVGAQTGWVLRPFIGAPNLPFEWFRERESNFFAALFEALGKLFV